MNIQTAISIGFGISIFLAVLIEGMIVTKADFTYLFSRPARLVRIILAMNILSPIVTVLIGRQFDLHPAVIIGLVTLSVGPVGALFPQAMLPLVGPGRESYVHGLFFASTFLSVFLTTLGVVVLQFLWGAEVNVSPMTIAQVSVGTMLLPLGIGQVLARWLPQAKKLIPAIQKVSSVLFAVSLIGILAVGWPLLASVVRQGTLAAIVLIMFAELALGHFLAGSDESDRTVLALATVSRHPGVAIAVASLTEQKLAPVGVLLAIIVGKLASIPYKKWRQQRRALHSRHA